MPVAEVFRADAVSIARPFPFTSAEFEVLFDASDAACEYLGAEERWRNEMGRGREVSTWYLVLIRFERVHANRSHCACCDAAERMVKRWCREEGQRVAGTAEVEAAACEAPSPSPLPFATSVLPTLTRVLSTSRRMLVADARVPLLLSCGWRTSLVAL